MKGQQWVAAQWVAELEAGVITRSSSINIFRRKRDRSACKPWSRLRGIVLVLHAVLCGWCVPQAPCLGVVSIEFWLLFLLAFCLCFVSHQGSRLATQVPNSSSRLLTCSVPMVLHLAVPHPHCSSSTSITSTELQNL